MRFHARFPSACRPEQAVHAPAAPAPAIVQSTAEALAPGDHRHWSPSRPLRMRAAAFVTTSDGVRALDASARERHAAIPPAQRPMLPAHPAQATAADGDEPAVDGDDVMHIHVSAVPPSDYYRTTAPYVMVASEPFDTLP